MNIIRHIVGNLHVGMSYLAVVRYVISRLKNGYRTFKALPREDRRYLIETCIKEHKENRDLYNDVMRGV